MTENALAVGLIDKIKRLRKLQGLSAEMLAVRMAGTGYNVTRATIANAESGRRASLTVDFADHAARALGLTLVQLITDPAPCPACKGEPPAGFTCNACGVAS
ncbi:helix-turn-helix transcriptional regulator [Streptomyces sp. H27-G5]|uniref:helix-turn-helix domain-containing protein n=1 Tax=Streptomyces sp. H27-G5 TaxID=2996698 RepID=UPI00226E133C|nr:helix-turn-helix transcriptional regulator [Streptomyces sp. H27-G5]MCY0916970.1 helix-turn-helix transcriptional regulator [Streptomyces sp. H27-G5]